MKINLHEIVRLLSYAIDTMDNKGKSGPDDKNIIIWKPYWEDIRYNIFLAEETLREIANDEINSQFNYKNIDYLAGTDLVSTDIHLPFYSRQTGKKRYF